jgi:Tol biopolymer transport system component
MEKSPPGGSIMSLKKIIISAAIAVVVLTAFGLQSTPEHKVLFEKAKFAMETKGDLNEAVKLFSELIQKYPGEREYAAKSQLYIGLCYEKLGLKEAVKAFQKVVDNYPEQVEAIKMAKEKLVKLERAQAALETGDRELKIRKVWTGAADGFGVPSFDGRYASFADWKTGDLALRDLKTGETRRLTNDGTWKKPMEFTLNSVISPDNRWVAYSWYNPQETYDLRLIGIDGSNKRILYSDKNFEIYPLQWSSDSQKILARRYPVSGEKSQIVLVNVTDGSIRVMKTFDDVFWLRASFFSDERYIACDFPSKGDPKNYDISLLSTDNSEEIPLVQHPANDRLLGCVPGKNEILFRSDRTGTWDLWTIRTVPGKVQEEPRPIKRNIGEVSCLSFTNNGSFYYDVFTRRATLSIAPFELATMKVQEQLSKPILGSNSSPVWSPDGEILAYITEVELPGLGYHRPLHVQNVKTGEDRELASDIEVRCPSWSSDGKTILVIGFDNTRRKEKDYKGGVYLIDVKNGNATAIVEFPPVDDWVRDIWWTRSIAVWSHDENSVFYINGGKLLKRDLKTGTERLLYKDEFLTRILALSPDGQKLVFRVDDRNQEISNLLIMPSSGGEAKELCRIQGLDKVRDATWSADGRFILFLDRKDKGSSLRRISLEGGESQIVWEPNKDLTSFSIHPSGKQIAFSTILEESEVYVMENFLPEEKSKKK